jgi:ribosomal protein S27AE
MICEICRGEGRLDTLFGEKRPCPECNDSGVAASPLTWAEQQLADAKAWREEMAALHHVSVDALFGEPQRAPPSFICPRCGAESFNLNDIAQRYCGRCHVFVDDPTPIQMPDKS